MQSVEVVAGVLVNRTGEVSTEAAEAGAARCRRSPASFGLCILLASMLGTPMLAGCRKPPPPAPPAEPELSAEEKELAREKRLAEDRERALNTLEKNARGELDLQQIKAILSNLEAFLPSVTGTPLESRTQALIAAQKQRIEDLAMASYEALLVEVERLSSLSSPDYRGGADHLYENFDGVEFENTRAATLVKEKMEDLMTFNQAEHDAEQILRKASSYKNQNELAKAIALLESFSDRFSKTPYYQEVRATIDEYYPLYKAEKTAEQEQLAIEWTPMPIESLTAHASSEEIFKQVDGGYLVENTTDGPAQMVGGEDSWIDWFLECEVKVEAGQELTLGVRSRTTRGTDMKQYESFKAQIPTGDWATLRLEVKEGLLTIINVGNLEVLHGPERLNLLTGGFCFYVLPGETLAVRKLQYKLFESVAPTEGADEGGEQDSDRKKD